MLYTRTPLFIGSGETFDHPEIKKDDDSPAEVLGFTRAGNTPFIPGSTIKGSLRRELEKFGMEDKNTELMQAVFGKGPEEGNGNDQGSGGKARFHDALLISRRMEPTPLPCWNMETKTFIEAHNCMDRITRTAADKMLFYQETVPAGVGFRLEITGRFGPDHAEAEKEAALLLAALEKFSEYDKGGLSLGADTASGRGRLFWELREVTVIEEDHVRKWLNDPSSRPFCTKLYQPVGSHRRTRLLSKGRVMLAPQPEENITIPIVLRFDSHFLVNDPPLQPELQKKKKGQDDDFPDHRPLRDEMGEVILPASSVRGTLRSQTEKIIRTLGARACEPGQAGTCRAADVKQDYQGLCLACRLFGAQGWRSPVRISDFRLTHSREETTQELLAIDRFTGGGKYGAKFNIQAIYKPVFEGEIEIELGRIAQVDDSIGKGDWGLGLLALVLRDLREGDISFGFGASKGYGSCTADIVCWDDEEFQGKARTGLENFREMVAKEQGGEDGQG